jgi:threonine aldolase
LGLDNKTFITLLKERGIQMGAIGGGIRAVTHIDVSREDIDKALEAITYSQK